MTFTRPHLLVPFLMIPAAMVAACSGGTGVAIDPIDQADGGSSGSSGSSGADGASGTDGATPATCNPGFTMCGTACVDLQIDKNNCGKCGNACALCAAGACVAGCPAPTTDCGGSCVDVSKTDLHCSKCGSACTGGKHCVASACACANGPTPKLGADVQPILTASCAKNGCHKTGAGGPQGGLNLAAGASYAQLVNVRPQSCSTGFRVTPLAPDQSYIINKLTNVALCAGSQMPFGGVLPAAQIDTISAWICNGAQNN